MIMKSTQTKVWTFILLMSMFDFILSDASFNNLIKSTESYLLDMSRAILDVYNKRCDVVSSQDCIDRISTCGFESCGSYFRNTSNILCSSDFVLVNPPNSSNCSSIPLAANSSIKLSDRFVSSDQNYSELAKEDICYTQKLDSFFPNFYSTIGYARWQYFGTPSGILRRYPGGPFCENYDHRRKEWYDLAIKKPINLIFTVDFSGSMNNSGKKDLILKVIGDIVQSLDSSSWFGVIPFVKQLNSNSSEEDENLKEIQEFFTLSQATDENKVKFLEELEEVKFIGEYDFNLSKVDDFIADYTTQNLGIDLNNIDKSNIGPNETGIPHTLVLHVIGNQISESNFGSPDVPTKYGSIYLTIDLKDNSPFVSQQCKAYRDKYSLHHSISSSDDVYLFTEKFRDLSALGVTRTSPIWKKYNDSFGIGDVLTASLPVYSGKLLLGVIGIDYDMATIRLRHSEFEFDLKILLSNLKSTNDYGVSICEIENLREKKCNPDSFNVSCNSLPRNSCPMSKISDITPKCTDSIDERIDFKSKNNQVCCPNKLKFIELIKADQSISSSNSSSVGIVTSSSSQNSTQVESKTDILTPFSSSAHSPITVNSTSSSSSNVASEAAADTSKGKDEIGNSNRIYLIIAIVILVVIGVGWYLSKNQSNQSTQSGNSRELTQLMNESNRGNYYE